MMTYEEFEQYGINLASLGVECVENAPKYFCTPKDAKIIGWAGVDGIHYCYVRGFDDMVFAVSPMNLPGDYVHPVAKNFEDFLRLLLSCGDSAALEQAWAWNEAQFEDFIAMNPPTHEQCAILAAIREKLNLAPMVSPFVYLKELHLIFDYSRIQFTANYYDIVTP